MFRNIRQCGLVSTHLLRTKCVSTEGKLCPHVICTLLGHRHIDQISSKPGDDGCIGENEVWDQEED